MECLIHWDGCSDETRQVLSTIWHGAISGKKRRGWPKAIRELLKPPETLKAAVRGPKHLREYEAKARRDGRIVMEDGVEIWPRAGNIYESDDMSLNTPFRFWCADLGRETVGRQGLYTCDAHSSYNIAVEPLGRPLDAYRVEDIADHFLNVVMDKGYPLMWRIEMGVWTNKFIFGIEVEGMKEKWGSLSDLFYIRQKHTSQGKANIERSFHEIQKRVDASGQTKIGRNRGEFEKGSKLMMKAAQGHTKALEYFWDLEECADCVMASAQALNQLHRRIENEDRFATPEEIWSERKVRPFRSEDLWYFMPIKKKARIRKGVIETKVPHYPRSFRFLCQGQGEAFPYLLHENYQVLIAFHPGRPWEGCFVFNAERSAKNVDGFKMGELMGKVEWFADVPEEDLSGNGDFSQVSKAKAGVRKAYREIVKPGTGNGTKKSMAQDSMGNALAQQTGSLPDDFTPDDARPAPLPQKKKKKDPAKSSRFGRFQSTEDREAEIARLTDELSESQV